jgi:hypothetical protein
MILSFISGASFVKGCSDGDELVTNPRDEYARWHVYSLEGRKLFTGDQVGACGEDRLLFKQASNSSVGNLRSYQSICVPGKSVILVAINQDGIQDNMVKR